MSYQYYNPQQEINYRTPQQNEEQKQAAPNSNSEQQNSNAQNSEKKPYKINISQVLVDFKNTIASIGAPDDINHKVYEYVAMVEDESSKESPRQATIVTNLKTASKILDEYISGTLGKPSNVVQDWIDAFLIQEVDYSADESKAAISASEQIEAEIEQTNPELKEQFNGKDLEANASKPTPTPQSAASQYNQYQQNINYRQKAPQTSAAQKSVEAKELRQETAPPAKKTKPKKKVIRPDGKVYQGGKLIGEKSENGTIRKYTEEEIQAKEAEAKTLTPAETPPAKNTAQEQKKDLKPKTKPKTKPISKNITVQKFYEKSKDYLKNGDTTKALESYRKTLNYAKKIKDVKSQAHIIYGMGESYNQQNNLAKATKCFYKATKRTKDLNIKAQSHHCMGEVYDEVGKFDLAMDHYFESLSLNGENESPAKQAQTLNKIGLMHANKYMSREAIDFYKMSLTMAKQDSPNIDIMGEVLENTGGAFQNLGKPQKALKYYQKAIICDKRADNKEAESRTYEKAADLMLKMKNTTKAKNLYKKALQKALLNKDSEQVKILQQKINIFKEAAA